MTRLGGTTGPAPLAAPVAPCGTQTPSLSFRPGLRAVSLRTRPQELDLTGSGHGRNRGRTPAPSSVPASPGGGGDRPPCLPTRGDTFHGQPGFPVPAVRMGAQEVTGPEEGRGRPEPCVRG